MIFLLLFLFLLLPLLFLCKIRPKQNSVLIMSMSEVVFDPKQTFIVSNTQKISNFIRLPCKMRLFIIKKNHIFSSNFCHISILILNKLMFKLEVKSEIVIFHPCIIKYDINHYKKNIYSNLYDKSSVILAKFYFTSLASRTFTHRPLAHDWYFVDACQA